jgi:hypothetical protein
MTSEDKITYCCYAAFIGLALTIGLFGCSGHCYERCIDEAIQYHANEVSRILPIQEVTPAGKVELMQKHIEALSRERLYCKTECRE